MKKFQQWCENYSLNQVKQDASADKQQFGTSWRGPHEVKDLIEFLAKYDPQGAKQVVEKIRLEVNQMLKSKQAQLSPEDAARIGEIQKSVRTDMNRYSSIARRDNADLAQQVNNNSAPITQ